MTEVDWDLLADHLGGVLAGTPDEARVARLVATDPEWRRAAAQLAAALDAVAADLISLPAAEPMPADVTARLTEALAAVPVPAQAAAGTGTTSTRRAATGAGPGTPRRAAPAPGPEAGRPPARPRARRRWVGAGALLAGVAAFAAVALGPLGLLDGSTVRDAGGAPEAAVGTDPQADTAISAENSDGRPLLAAPGEAVKVATGTDYGPGTVSTPPAVAQDLDEAGPDDPRSLAARPAGVPPELTPLWHDPAPCLAAVAAALPSPPLTFERLDFARFEGEPAVVIWVATSDDTRWVIAAGPGCGRDHAEVDARYQRQLE